jgi:hypothetical protein
MSGVALSGNPSPFASAYKVSEFRSKLSPVLFATTRLKVSRPLPVFRKVCGNAAWPPGVAKRDWPSVVSVKLATCCTSVIAILESAVRCVPLLSV